MNKVVAWTFAIAAVIALIVALLAFGVWLDTVLWAWIVPDVFSGAVKAHLLPATITFWQSAKLSIFFWLVMGIQHVSSSSSSKK